MDSNNTICQENSLKKVKTNLSIYDDVEINHKPNCSDNLTLPQMNARNVLEGISREALLLQAADRNIARDKRRLKTQIKPSRNFIPLTEFTDFGCSVATKLDTETGVSDTQLIAFADGAEAVMQMVANTGITQLFDVSFERKTFKENKNETKNSHNLYASQKNKQHACLTKNNHEIVKNLHAKESDNLNASKTTPKDSNTICYNSNNNLTTSSVIIEQNNIGIEIVHEDNNQDDKTKKDLNITDDSNTMFEDNFIDNITLSPILDEKSPNIEIIDKYNNHLDNTSTNNPHDTNTMVNDNIDYNITSSPILNEISPDRKIITKYNHIDNTYRKNHDDSNTIIKDNPENDINNIILYNVNSGSTNLSSRNYLNDSNISLCDNMENNIPSSPILNNQSTDNPLFHEDINNHNNKTKNNISTNDNTISESTSPTLNKKRSNNIKCDNEYNQNDKNEAETDINYLDSKHNMRSRSILKRKNAYNLLSYEDDNNQIHKSTMSSKKYRKKNDSVPKHRKYSSQYLPEKILHKSRSPSPVLNTQRSNYLECKKITNKTFSLHDFEEFEAVHRQDLGNIRSPIYGNKVKVNSQIMNNEMCISRIADKEYDNGLISDMERSKIDISCRKDSKREEEIVRCDSLKEFNFTKTFEVFDTASNGRTPMLKDTSTKSCRCLETSIVKSVETFEKIENSEDTIAKSKIHEACVEGSMIGIRHDPGVSTLESDTNQFGGFTTANHKEEICSGDAITKNGTLLDDACLEEDAVAIEDSHGISTLKTGTITNEFYEFTTASNEKDAVSEDDIAKSRMLLDEACLEENIFENKETSYVSTLKPDTNSSFQGFVTANNNKIAISEDAIAKSKMLLDEACLEGDSFVIKKTNNISTLKSDTNSKFQGIVTANNKKITISEDANAKSKMLLDEASLEEDSFVITETKYISKLKPYTNSKFQGFVTANNKKITISEDAIAKSKMLLDEACLEEDSFVIEKTNNISTLKFDTNSKFQGIVTANNKKITISEDANAKSKMLLDEASLEEDSFAIEKTNNVSTLKPDTNSKFQGFVTANNKKITISEDAITKSKMLLDEACLEEDSFVIEKTNNISTLKPDTNSKFQGFMTANNKKITISEDAIAKSKMLLDEACLEEDGFVIEKTNNVSTLKPDTNSKFQGFVTANNKKITISEDAITKSKMLLDEACLEEDSFVIEKTNNISTLKPDTNSKFQGFVTANNKKISISEDAIARSKMLLDEACLKEDSFVIKKTSNVCTLKPDTNSKFQGFVTANNKKITISEDAIAKSKMLLDEACLEEDSFAIKKTSNFCTLKPDTNSKFQGFVTANNKKITISEDAIAKSKMLLDETCLEEDSFVIKKTNNISTLKPDTGSKFQGFVTANNKKITISEDAIAKSKMLLDETCLEEDSFVIKKTNNISTLKPDTGSKFQGFVTANNKKITISEDAIAKSKMLLDETCLEEDSFVIKKTNNISTLKPDTGSKFQGFVTANNKKITISEDAIAKSKMLLDEACLEEDSFAIKKTSNVCKVESNLDFKEYDQIEIKELIDTQVIDNFDQSKFTQEIEHKENGDVKLRKRASSPILCCPKAKKYKNTKKTFKVPYSQTKTQNINKIDDVDSKTTQTFPQTKISKINFTNLNDIKCNRYNNRILLKDLKQYNNQFIISNDVLDDSNNINNLDDLLHFKFKEQPDNLPELKNVITFQDLKFAFEESVNKSLIPNGWIENHFKLILWKLMSYGMLFGNSFDGTLSVRNVLDQLKYRLDRELYQVRRPAIRKILECDEPPGRTMVLCVAKIYKTEDGKSPTNNCELDLTDSWYVVRSTLDAMLNLAVENGKIKVGTKLLIYGAELQNCEQGKSPLEDTSAIRLKIFGNSTRRVPWDTKLGFFPRPGPFRINLDTVKPTGGKIAKMRVFVARVYPPVYIEKLQDGSTVTRSERLESIYASKFESDKQNRLEKIYAQIEREFSDIGFDSQDDSPDMCTEDENCSERDIHSGSQLFKTLRRCHDPVDFQAHLTSTQTNRLKDFNSKKRDRIMSKIQERVRQKITESGVDKLNRNVVQLLKIRIVDWSVKQETISRMDSTKKPSSDKNSNIVTGVISIWKPSEGLSEIIGEGIWLDVINSTPTAVRMSEIHISAGRQTIFNKCKKVDVNENEQKMALRNVKSIENIVQNGTSDMLFNEIDTVGLIVGIEPDVFNSKLNFQNIYLADRSNSVICLNFWGGIEKFGYASLVKIGAFVSCSNLQNRMGNSRRNIPHFRVTELSSFSLFPRNVIFSDALNKIKSDFVGIEVENFCRNFKIERIQKPVVSTCSTKLCDSETSKSAMSPFGLQNKTEYDLEKNRHFIETPQTRDTKRLKLDILDMNLDSLDFESTFSANSCSMDVKMTDVKVTDVKVTDVKVTDVKVTPVKMISVHMNPVNMTAVKTDETIVEISPRLQEQKKRTRAKIERLKMYGEAPKLSPITILNRSEVRKSYVNPLAGKNDSPSATNDVASLKNDTVQNYLKCVASTSERNWEMLSDSPKTKPGVRRFRINPVKLQFQREHLNECDIIQDEDFADDFEYSPPLSLD